MKYFFMPSIRPYPQQHLQYNTKMLTNSRQPQIIRLHQLQQTQRTRYINQFTNVGQQYLPHRAWPFLPIVADIYYTYTTICKCRRRLGQQYTYVAMYNAKHYQQQGVLVNSNTRTLMFVLQILQRYLVKYLLNRLWVKLQQRVDRGGRWRIVRQIASLGVNGVLEQGKLFMLMLFVLGWNKHYNVIDTILGNQYVYTYFNKNNEIVDYRVQGYMLLVVFAVKLVKFIISTYKVLAQKPKNRHKESMVSNISSEVQPSDHGDLEESQMCRICYDRIVDKSVTCCGHIFCWRCILKYLETHPECPVCRAECEPREIVQLQNY